MHKSPFTVDVCICTFRRPSIAQTLGSLAAMTLPEGCTLRMIVADNDTTPSAQKTVTNTAAHLGLTVSYLHAPAANISIARNACLEAATAAYIAWIDDDETASPLWLNALLARMDESNADAVLGPVQALYPANCPKWLHAGDFHSTQPVWTNQKIITGYTGNALLRNGTAALNNLRFREDLGISGGEDSDFFSRLYAAGGTITYANDAIIYETIPPARATLRWLLARRYRYGKTHAVLQHQSSAHALSIIRVSAKIALCFLMALLTFLYPHRWRYWLLRGTLHLGVIQTLLTRRYAH